MIAAASVENLLSWAAQVLVVASLGAILPIVFRIRHPQWHLAYCQLVLASCLVLPLVQPWRHPLIAVGADVQNIPPAAPVSTSADAAATTRATWPWERVALWTLLAGVSAKLFWFGAGLFQLRRCRNTASLLGSIPEAIRSAQAITGVDAAFRVSTAVRSPVTFGFFQPIILLPESFFSLDPDAQCAIACHELLHVRRKDWLFTVVEEAVSVLFWFNPAAWLLFAQVRLAREQVVDAQVVRLTQNRESYIKALVTMAAGRYLDLTPAPLFLRRRHLSQRLHSILTEACMSKLRLFSSYTSMMVILALAGWLAFASFPLLGQAQVQFSTAVIDPPGITVNTGGNVLRRGSIAYPAEARQKRIEGTVFVEAALDSNGNVVDAHVISGPDELRKAVLQSVLQWRYAAESTPSRTVVSRTVVVNVDFRLPTESETKLLGVVAAPPVRAGTGQQSNSPAALGPAANGAITNIDIGDIAEPLRTELRQRLQKFQGQPFTPAVDNELQQIIRNGPPESRPRVAYNLVNGKVSIQIFPGAPPTVVSSVATANGAETVFAPPPPPPPPPPSTPVSANDRIRVSPEVLSANLTEKVAPEYPPLARAARVTGVVIIEIVVGTDGHVSAARIISGHPLLQGAAMDAIRQWVFSPFIQNGQPTEVVSAVTLNFAFQ
jgi:TonB family protein